MTHKRQVHEMLKRFDNPIFMTNEEMDVAYEGMFVLVKKRDKSDLIYYGGYVLATIENAPNSRDALYEILEKELDFNGYIHYGHIDKGESLDVVYITSK